MKSKIIAVSAIGAGLAAICLTLGAYIEILDLVGVVLSSVFIIMPVYFRSYKGSVLTYLAAGIIAFLFSGFNIYSLVFPIYFGFFGIYPPIKCLANDKNFNNSLFTVLGLIWCVAAAFGAYYFYIYFSGVELFTNFPDWVGKYAVVLVGLIGVVFYFVFDKFVFISRVLINKYLGRIIK